MTIHLLYPHKNRISAPNIIGFKLASYLSKFYEIELHDFDSFKSIKPQAGDVLIGHPHPMPFTSFKRSFLNKGWRKRIILQPFNHDPRQVGYLDPLIDSCDAFLAITGNHWFDTLPESIFSRWSPKMKHLDLAVDRSLYPQIKFKFNPPGARRFIYIGNDHPGKNLNYLNSLAQALDLKITWAGKGSAKHNYSNLVNIGHLDFSTEIGKSLVADHDFMITVGSFDANPTTVLESMSWGLIPVCTKTSGYNNIPGIINIEGVDLIEAMKQVNHLMFLDNQTLIAMQATCHESLQKRFTWDIFCKKVMDAIEDPSKHSSRKSPNVPKTPHIRSALPLYSRTILKNIIRRWLK